HRGSEHAHRERGHARRPGRRHLPAQRRSHRGGGGGAGAHRPVGDRGGLPRGLARRSAWWRGRVSGPIVTGGRYWRMITITEKAAGKVKEIAEAENLNGQGLRLRVVGGGCA